MKIVQIHVVSNHGSANCRNCNSQQTTYYKRTIFPFKKKPGNDEIVNDIIVRSDENQIAKFDGHRPGNGDGITAKDNHPQYI